ncbi:hypothetical protein BKA67DRAFT_428602 [Truncatella angustata]|uniref:Nephrocystin 3-like N-terminal domain-containing protein n=1 Tax=Truncatella angustata TaxID=152316 RepID=A0A9P8RJI9_9PEZI|nr:uncharacterized protein BKA67DRAFT_428602 [Truncatella angustata]KAH6647213.1 hypothetical protein BKA67DRAFT_428602 [Truncatella angustata]
MTSSQNFESIKDKIVKINRILTDFQCHEIFKWFECADPSPVHRRNQKLHQPETGRWMVRSLYWSSWLAGVSRCLWLYGMPGAGKTVLMSYLIEETISYCKAFKNKKTTWVYYY